MPHPTEIAPAAADARMEGDCLAVDLSGAWKITEPSPAWPKVVGNRTPKQVRLDVQRVASWDSALLLFIFEAQQWCQANHAEMDTRDLPPKIVSLLGQFNTAGGKDVPVDRSADFFTRIGLAALDAVSKTRAIAHFVGECTLSAFRLFKRPDRFRWRDWVAEMQQCGAMALPIVGLISLLVGLTMAYTAAVLLREFGADIYVADFVGLVMVREMGPMMTAIILAGRTGAAFAATLGNMKANEEIDALVTLGIRPVDFLVMPRMLALGLMMPLLVLYSNMLGMVGGQLVATGILSIPPAAYWIEMQTAVDLSDVLAGLIKALIFGVIVGLSGCLRGLQSERSAAGVGQAATSAVVTAILLLIVADAIFAVLFDILGL